MIATEPAEVVPPRRRGRQLGHLIVRGPPSVGTEDVDRCPCEPGRAVAVSGPRPRCAVDRHGYALSFVTAASAAVSLATWSYVAPPSVVRKT